MNQQHAAAAAVFRGYSSKQLQIQMRWLWAITRRTLQQVRSLLASEVGHCSSQISLQLWPIPSLECRNTDKPQRPFPRPKSQWSHSSSLYGGVGRRFPICYVDSKITTEMGRLKPTLQIYLLHPTWFKIATISNHWMLINYKLDLWPLTFDLDLRLLLRAITRCRSECVWGGWQGMCLWAKLLTFCSRCGMKRTMV